MFVKRRSFARTRRATGFTQESLAERLEVDRTTVARWESGEYTPQPWLRPKIAKAFGISLGALRELMDVVGEAEATRQTVEVSTALVKVDDVPPAGHDEMADAECAHDQLSQAMELGGAYAEANAPQTTLGLSQLPWDTDRLAVLTAHAIMAALATITDGAQAADWPGRWHLSLP